MSDFEKTLIDAMARRCGLEPPDEFARTMTADRSPRVPGFEQGTGRTTRMLLQALVALEAGLRVEVVVRDEQHYTDIDGRLMGLIDVTNDYAAERGRMRYRWEGCETDPHTPPHDLRLVDHEVTETANFERAKRAARRSDREEWANDLEDALNEHAHHEDGRLRTSPVPTAGGGVPGFRVVSMTCGGRPTVNGGQGGTARGPKAVTVEDWETLLARVTALEMVAQAPMFTLRSTPDHGTEGIRRLLAEAESHGLILDPDSEMTIELIVPREVLERLDAIEGRLEALETPADLDSMGAPVTEHPQATGPVAPPMPEGYSFRWAAHRGVCVNALDHNFESVRLFWVDEYDQEFEPGTVLLSTDRAAWDYARWLVGVQRQTAGSEPAPTGEDYECEFAKHLKWDVRKPERGVGWRVWREYDGHKGEGNTLLEALRDANAKSERGAE